jgi:hypothetical protein
VKENSSDGINALKDGRVKSKKVKWEIKEESPFFLA